MEKKPIKRFFEITFVILIVFGIIALVFLLLNYGFEFLKIISANVVSGIENSSASSGVLHWFIITALTAFVVFYILKFLVRKNFLKMKSGQVSEVEVDY